jgi:hypothetical protein
MNPRGAERTALQQPAAPARDLAVDCARRVFYRPAALVDDLSASFRTLSTPDYPGREGVANACYRRPIRMGATLEVFRLRALHRPMLKSARRRRPPTPHVCRSDGERRDGRTRGGAGFAALA